MDQWRERDVALERGCRDHESLDHLPVASFPIPIDFDSELSEGIFDICINVRMDLCFDINSHPPCTAKPELCSLKLIIGDA